MQMMLLNLPDVGFIMNSSNESADEYNQLQKKMTIDSVINNICQMKTNSELNLSEGLNNPK